MHETRLSFRIPADRVVAVRRALAVLAPAGMQGEAGVAAAPRRWRAQAAPREIRVGRSRLRITLRAIGTPAGGLRDAEHRLEFALLRGKRAALFQLTRSWVERFDLSLDLRTWLPGNEGPSAGAGASSGVRLKKSMPAQRALQTLVAGVLRQLLLNLAQLLQPGDPLSRAAQAQALHQARVALRRLRCAAWLLGGHARDWNPTWEVAIRALFVELGSTRDQEVLQTSVMPTLRALQAPLVDLAAPVQPAALAPVLQAPEVSHLLWDLLQFAHAEAGGPADRLPSAVHPALIDRVKPSLDALRRRVAGDLRRFTKLDDVGVHTLRKRLKRLRYSLEFLAPLLPGRRWQPYLRSLLQVQAGLGSWHDLAVAEALYRQRACTDARAWFAVGWAVARKTALRDEAAVHLQQLARLQRPW